MNEIELLRRMVENGDPVSRMALALHRSEWAIYSRMRQDGTVKRRSRWSAEEIGALVEMSGRVSQRRAARLLRRPRTQVQRTIDELGIYWPVGLRSPVRFDDAMDQAIRRGLSRGDTWRRTAAAVGRAPLAVRRRAARLGLQAGSDKRSAG